MARQTRNQSHGIPLVGRDAAERGSDAASEAQEWRPGSCTEGAPRRGRLAVPGGVAGVRTMLAAFPMYIVGGGIAGLLAGRLGVGGGLVIVPMLGICLAREGIALGAIMHMALATSATEARLRRAAARYGHAHALQPAGALRPAPPGAAARRRLSGRPAAATGAASGGR